MNEETRILAENIVNNLNQLLKKLKEKMDRQSEFSDAIRNIIRDTVFGLCILSKNPIPRDKTVAIWIYKDNFGEYNPQSFNDLSSIFSDANLLCSQTGNSGEAQVKSSVKNTPLIPGCYSTYEYYSKFFIKVDQNCSFCKRCILCIFLNRLWEIFDRLEWLDVDNQDDFIKKFFDFDFMKEYIRLIYDEFRYLPEREILNEISFKNYEGREIHASIYFLRFDTINDLHRRGIKNIAFFNEACYLEGGMNCSDNESYVRKMLEMCNTHDFHLIAQIKESSNGVEEAYPAALINCKEKDIHLKQIAIKEMCIEFEARGIWQMRYQDEIILKCKNNRYYVDDEMEHDMWKNELRSKIKALPEDTLSALIDTVDILKKSNHGALMILSNDAQALSDTLCVTYKRGTRIEAISLKNPDERNLFARLSSIDGATLVDLNAKCYAFSVILDGEAKIEGDLGKGARHNSAKNYVANGDGRYAIVISEDKENAITIYPDK